MVSELALYFLTTLALIGPWPLLYYARKLTIMRIVLLLFFLDTVLTIEAALYGNVVAIAVLHVITIPAFVGLIYFDLVRQARSTFRCFICGRQVTPQDEIETVTRAFLNRPAKVIVHASCVKLQDKDRKSMSSRVFRKGIPK